MRAEDFVFRVEHLQKQYAMPWIELLRDFHRLLTEEASEWYWLLIRTKPPHDWRELKEAIQRRYCDNRSDYDRIQDIEE
ncbi:hypothetical protein KR026_006455, partial [Drosophila bipectinata]